MAVESPLRVESREELVWLLTHLGASREIWAQRVRHPSGRCGKQRLGGCLRRRLDDLKRPASVTIGVVGSTPYSSA
jgi:hypothetical protein